MPICENAEWYGSSLFSEDFILLSTIAVPCYNFSNGAKVLSFLHTLNIICVSWVCVFFFMLAILTGVREDSYCGFDLNILTLSNVVHLVICLLVVFVILDVAFILEPSFSSGGHILVLSLLRVLRRPLLIHWL